MNSSTQARLTLVEPASGNAIAELPLTSPAEVQAAVTRASKAQPHWASMPCSERAKIIHKWRNSLISNGEALARALSRENGKPIHEAWFHELVPLCGALTWVAEEAPQLLAERSVSLRWMKQYKCNITARARGQCAIIAPYNFPVLIPFADAAAALAAGCSVIVKPSELTPLIALTVAKLAHEAGLDSALLQVLPGGPETACALLDADVDEVTFTGSLDHGREVARHCAERLIPCTLELGGKASLVVFEDADVESAATATVFGALANSGQSCIAVERVIVHRRLRRALVESVVQRVKALRQGNPLHAEVDLGALTAPASMNRLKLQVDDAIAQGARLLCGGHPLATPGQYFAPTVLDECTPTMRVVCEESFGPIIPIVSVESTGEAIDVANSGASELAAYLFGRDETRLRALAPNLRAGHVLLNDVLWSYVCPEIPFGGQHQSGFGVVHGREGLLSHTRPVHLGTTRLKLPDMLGIAFPYSEKARSFLQRTLRLVTR